MRMPSGAALRMATVATLAIGISAASAGAQDATGHWEGVIRVPEGPVAVAIDLSKDATGRLVATFTRTGTNIKGLPLVDVAQNGRGLTFTLRAGSGGGTFVVALGDDSKTLTGHYHTAEGGYSIPFDATRTGSAQVEQPLRNAALAPEFVGNWTGALDVGAAQVPLVLALTNVGDGSSRGMLTLTQRPGVEIEAAMTQKGTALTLTFRMIGASFAGTLNEARTELTGTYTGDGASYPLTFRRAAPKP